MKVSPRMNMSQNDTELYLEQILSLAHLIKVFGAKEIWKDLKLLAPKAHNKLLLAALEQLPK